MKWIRQWLCRHRRPLRGFGPPPNLIFTVLCGDCGKTLEKIVADPQEAAAFWEREDCQLLGLDAKTVTPNSLRAALQRSLRAADLDLVPLEHRKLLAGWREILQAAYRRRLEYHGWTEE